MRDLRGEKQKIMIENPFGFSAAIRQILLFVLEFIYMALAGLPKY